MSWTSVKEFEDIRYEKTEGGQIAKITINRPEVRNVFRPQTVKEMLAALELAHEDPQVGVIILTGEGDLAFCSGGDQKVRGHGQYFRFPSSFDMRRHYIVLFPLTKAF